MDAETVLKDHERLRSDRQPHHARWRELARLLRPDDVEIDPRSGTDTPSRDDAEVFDTTPLLANESFAGGMFSQLVNPASRWFELQVTDDEDLSKWKPVAEWLWLVANVIRSSLKPARSGFYAGASQWFADIGAIGWGAMFSEEAQDRRGFVDRAFPIGEVFLDVDLNGNVIRVHREFKGKGRQLKQSFGAAADDFRDDDTYQIVHAVFQNENRRLGRLDHHGMPWASVYTSPDKKSFFRRRGYWEMPYAVPGWARRTRSAYATGPGHNILPDAQTLQEQERTMLVAAQHAAEPTILTHDESVFSALDFYPGVILHGTLTGDGKRLADLLERRSQPQLALENMELRRERIRRAYFFLMEHIRNRPQMTAAEFLGWKEEELVAMGPNLVRVQTDGLSPVVTRRFNVLARAGRVPPPPPELQGRELEVDYVSPLGQLLKTQGARRALQIADATERLAMIDPTAADNFDADAAWRAVHAGLGGDPGLMRDPDQVRALRERRAEEQARQAELVERQAETKMLADMSHAAAAAEAAG